MADTYIETTGPPTSPIHKHKKDPTPQFWGLHALGRQTR